MSYELTELLQEARGNFPSGTSYGLKRASFPDVYRVEPEKRMRIVLINATPEEYRTHSSGQEAARFNVVVNEWDMKDVERENIGSEDRPWRRIEAVRFGGLLELPHLVGTMLTKVSVVGAYVPNEVSTGFVHLEDGEHAAHLDRAFEETPSRCELPLR